MTELSINKGKLLIINEIRSAGKIWKSELLVKLKDKISKSDFEEHIELLIGEGVVEFGSNVNLTNMDYEYSVTSKTLLTIDALVRQINQDEKQKYDLILSKHQKRTFFSLFAVSIIGCICGIILVVLKLTEEPDKKTPQTQPTTTIGTISSLHQTKKVDSTHSSKPDSLNPTKK